VERLFNLLPENIIRLKDSSYKYEETLAFLKNFPHLKIYAGKDIDTSSLVSQGAVGTISALANIAPNLMNSLYEYDFR
jgi:dihydrodipicolinate synthase/N-acetylneuraminate lyase